MGLPTYAFGQEASTVCSSWVSGLGWYGTFHIQVPMFEKINKQSFEEEAFKTVDLLFRMVNCRCTELVIAVGTQ